MANRFKKGDKVVVVKGKDKGKQGEILTVYANVSKVIVDSINEVTTHKKATKESQGGKIVKPAPIHWSNVRLLCPKTDKPTRVSFVSIDKEKKRKAKNSGETF